MSFPGLFLTIFSSTHFPFNIYFFSFFFRFFFFVAARFAAPLFTALFYLKRKRIYGVNPCSSGPNSSVLNDVCKTLSFDRCQGVPIQYTHRERQADRLKCRSNNIFSDYEHGRTFFFMPLALIKCHLVCAIWM